MTIVYSYKYYIVTRFMPQNIIDNLSKPFAVGSPR